MSPTKCVVGLVCLIIAFHTSSPVFAEASTTLKSYYSPILKLEVDNGYFLISTDSGIQWIQVEEPGKSLLHTLSVGDMIDIVVELRQASEPDEFEILSHNPPPDLPPLLKSWKLARSSSPCKIFNGKTCRP